MGSTSCASISNLHFIPNRSHDRLGSIRNQLAPVRARAHYSRRPRPELSLRSRRRLRNDVVCSAVEDDLREKQEEFGAGTGTGVGSAVEDRPATDVVDDSKEEGGSAIYNFLYPSQELLPDDKEMSIFDHLEELRERIFISVAAVGVAMLGCFAVSKDLIVFLEAPVKTQGVKFLQLAPGEFFFTTLKVSGYCGLLLGSPIILYEIIAFVLPGLTRDERRFLGPIVFGSSLLFYAGISFSYLVLVPAALNFFVTYAEGVVESLWSIDQYFEFVLVLMFSTGLSFQVMTSFQVHSLCLTVKFEHFSPETSFNSLNGIMNSALKSQSNWNCILVPVIQVLLGQVGLVSGDQMLSIWRYVVVGAVVAAAVLTPSTDPLTQVLLAAPLLGLYFGGAWVVKLTGR